MENAISTFPELVGQIFEVFPTVIGGLASGLQEAFTNLVYNGGVQGDGFSPFIIFMFVLAGLGLGTGLLYGIFGLIKGLRNRP